MCALNGNLALGHWAAGDGALRGEEAVDDLDQGPRGRQKDRTSQTRREQAVAPRSARASFPIGGARTEIEEADLLSRSWHLWVIALQHATEKQPFALNGSFNKNA
jgi:hypothetical protein